MAGSTATLTLAGCLSQSLISGQPSCSDESAIAFAAQTDQFVVVTTNNAVETLEFTLENHADCPLTVSTSAWIIERKTNGGWKQVDAGQMDENQRTVSNGDEHKWSLSLSPHPTQKTDSTTFVTADLEEGTYRFVITGTLADDTQIKQRAKFVLEKRAASKTSTET